MPDAGFSGVGGTAPAAVGSGAQVEVGLASAVQERMLQELVVQRGLL